MKVTQKNAIPAPNGWRAIFIATLLFCAAIARADDDFQGASHLAPFDEGPNPYSKATPTGPVARLQQKLDQGEAKLKYDAKFGYLLSVLDWLKIPRSSQMLVFSKTSFQRDRISPSTPRALFMNDDVYIGFIPGAPLMEISMADPKMGAVFYTLSQKETNSPKFVRNDQCLECHAGARTMGVPGHVLRSLITDETGAVDLNTGLSEVNDRTPLAERWSGWYVTGTHGNQLHRGNLIGQAAFDRQEKEPNYLGNVTNLSKFFDTDAYPASGSDIVALMVLEHQTHMHNFIARLNVEAKEMISMYGHVKYLKTIEEAFLKYMLFMEEAPLTAPIHGNSDFTQTFEQLGPKDHLGRSLREFDLKTRLFKYPCSYLIYSDAFDTLPNQLKADLYQRLWNILNGKDDDLELQRIPTATRRALLEIITETKPVALIEYNFVRRALLEIITETKPGLPAYWKLEH